MAIRIQPYTDELIGEVADFNRRMAPASITFQIPDAPRACWLPKVEGRNIYQEVFLAIEDGSVRGGYTFKYQEFSLGGCIRSVGSCQMPISEGILDRRYSLVGIKILDDALRREPLSYGLGIGDPGSSLVRMLLAMDWSMRSVPFYFKVRSGFRFLRNIRYLRTSPARRWALDAAAYSGLGSLALKYAQAWSGLGRHHPPASAAQVECFGPWAGDLWLKCHARYSMAGVREPAVLNLLYPPEDPRFIRLKVSEGEMLAGWAVLLDTAMSGSKYFGDMRVGSIADCFAAPEHAPGVIEAAVRVLEQRGVDLMVSNQNHPAWGRALRRAGFLRGPSNFLFLTSKPLSELIAKADPRGERIHINRGDGDGPIHL